MNNPYDLLSHDQPGQLVFYGNRGAELFTREIAASLEGVLRYNLYGPAAGADAGFVSASAQGRVCTGQFWSRDGGTLARELIHYGYANHAAMIMDCIMRLAEKNAEGYYALPMYWLPGTPAAGNELDGTATVTISMMQLLRRLDADDPRRARYYRFLHDEASPLAYIHHAISSGPLVPGHGEFGGGMGVDGLHCNVVQNGLCRLVLLAAAQMEAAAGDVTAARRHAEGAAKLTENMRQYLLAEDGGWIWCVNAETMRPEQAVLDAYWNKGFAGIEGACCMQADICGFDTASTGWIELDACRRTHERLAAEPHRKALFAQLGMWPQFGSAPFDKLTSASYGQGYGIQTMLLLDRLEEAEHALNYLAQATFAPHPAYQLDRDSPYWFYERYLAPDFPEMDKFDQGCGALNTVNVSEPLKVARLLAGLDDSGAAPRIIPRLPASWSGYRATAWPLFTGKETVLADIDYQQHAGAVDLSITVRHGKSIPALTVSLGQPEQRRHVTETVVTHVILHY